MLSKNQIKFINSLKINKFRKAQGAFIVEGRKNVEELLASTLITKQIFASADWINNMARSLSNVIECNICTDEELKKISDFITPDQVLAIAEIPVPIPEIDFTKNILVLDGIRDPGNMGTIIRTADWFGFDQIICSQDSVDIFNPKVIQATMGSFTRVNVIYTQLVDFLMNKPAGIPVYGAVLGGIELGNNTFNRAGMLIIGSESHGIRENILPLISHPVTIPDFNLNSVNERKAESLNASVATAILCYEMVKKNIIPK
jgi:RNA methyltransferase, TrmH family